MVKGINQDNKVCPFPNTRTLQCLNPFCGFTWGEDMDEVSLRRIDGLSECPMCHGTEYEIVGYNFKGVYK